MKWSTTGELKNSNVDMNIADNSTCSIHKLTGSILSHLQAQVTINSFEAAIRELVQNSLDANADEINIKLDLRSLSICIEDNGRGMTPNELENVGKRYFTSKIKQMEDLKDIETFGFRGEALHSLSCISHLSVISKHQNQKKSFKLKIIDGTQDTCEYDFKTHRSDHLEQHFKVDPLSTNGTIVMATNLFANVPVRRNQILNFQEHKLLDLIKQVVLQSLICGPNVKLTIYQVDPEDLVLRKVTSIPKNKNNESHCRYVTVLRSIYGSSILPEYETVKAEFQDYKINGIIGLNPYQSKLFQYIFLNGRPILQTNETSKQLNKVFLAANFGSEVYFAHNNDVGSPQKVSPSKQSMSRTFSKFPIFIISVRSPVIIIDLLQDPSKSISYSSQLKLIMNILNNMFSSFLISQGYSITKSSMNSPSPSPKRRKQLSPSRSREILLPVSIPKSQSNLMHLRSPFEINEGPTISLFDNALSSQGSPINKSKPNLNMYSRNYLSNLNNEECGANVFNSEVLLNKDDLLRGGHRIIKQIDRKFILLIIQTRNHKSGDQSPILVAVDQHACDERIQVEKLLKDFMLLVLKRSLTNKLKFPLVISISNKEGDLFRSYSSNLLSMGIVYNAEKNYELEVTHLPRILIEKIGTDKNFLKACLLQHLYDLEGHNKQAKFLNITPDEWFKGIIHLPQIVIDIINTKACRSAIMFGDKLTLGEMTHLVEKLFECNQPFICAHGRPSIVPLVSF